jgi:hypothetical protein
MRIYPTSLGSSCISGEYKIALLICTAITQSSRDLHRVEGIESTVNLMNLYLYQIIVSLYNCIPALIVRLLDYCSSL